MRWPKLPKNLAYRKSASQLICQNDRIGKSGTGARCCGCCQCRVSVTDAEAQAQALPNRSEIIGSSDSRIVTKVLTNAFEQFWRPLWILAPPKKSSLGGGAWPPAPPPCQHATGHECFFPIDNIHFKFLFSFEIFMNIFEVRILDFPILLNTHLKMETNKIIKLFIVSTHCTK